MKDEMLREMREGFTGEMRGDGEDTSSFVSFPFHFFVLCLLVWGQPRHFLVRRHLGERQEKCL